MYGKISRLPTKRLETKYTITKPVEEKMAKRKINEETHFNDFFLR